MKCVDIPFAVLISAAFLAAGLAGCRERSVPTSAAATGRTTSKPGPEESFEQIVQTFRRGVADVPIGFVVRQEGGHSMMVGKNEVSHEIIPPMKEGDLYRAVITVNSQSRYSIQRTNEPEEGDPDDEADNQSSAINRLTESGDASGLEILDPSLVGTSGSNEQKRRSSAGSAEKFVARRPDEGERKYELVYENGRWALVTKLNPETEQSIRNAFDQALKTQS